jgi:DNA-binding NarL/FixJ family response regulator
MLFLSFRRIRPDGTLMNQRLPGARGTDALIAIRKESPRAIVMMVTTSKQDMDVTPCAQCGGRRLCFEEHPKSRDAARDPLGL